MAAEGATESNGRAVALKPWQFQPGQSGNPGGRAKGLAALVRERTLEGAELVDFHMAIMRGEALPQPGARKRLRPSLQQRMQAADWLADRGFGRVAQPVTGGDGGPLEVAHTVEVRAMDYRLGLRALAPPDDAGDEAAG